MMSEAKVLKKLDIADFRHLTKDKVIKMASMLDKMDPEVAKKALEQLSGVLLIQLRKCYQNIRNHWIKAWNLIMKV